jgi:geranylgeranyl reductase family protein
MIDVIVAGAGPAGSIAALVLARAGVRVLIVDRETFPRDKLCGDTLNPGAVRRLADLGLTGGALAGARPLSGMLVSGPRASVRTEYGDGRMGLAIRRHDLDAWLLERAIEAGARFAPGWRVAGPLISRAVAGDVVRGIVLSRVGSGRTLRLPAQITIAADGRRSTLARHLGLVRPTRAPRRWAYGTYADNVGAMGDVGEMHVRHGWYLGLAPMPDGRTNVCVVTPLLPRAPAPMDVIRRAIDREPPIAARFARVAWSGGVRVLGPLATDVERLGAPGLLLAGDAAGFIDPMTGDGLHLAMRSAMLAAEHALQALVTGDVTVAVDGLTRAHRAQLGPKLRFNRAVRRLVDARGAVEAAGLGARWFPAVLQRAVRYAGDIA